MELRGVKKERNLMGVGKVDGEGECRRLEGKGLVNDVWGGVGRNLYKIVELGWWRLFWGHQEDDVWASDLH